MERTIYLNIPVLAVLQFTAVAEDMQLQTTLPSDVGAIVLQVTLDDTSPAVFDNYSGVSTPRSGAGTGHQCL